MNYSRCLRRAGFLLLGLPLEAAEQKSPALTRVWTNNSLTLRGEPLPGRELKIHYLDAYCRPNSQRTDWVTLTVVGHSKELLSISEDRTQLKLKCRLKDGVGVDGNTQIL